jgi:hypothetical protein
MLVHGHDFDEAVDQVDGVTQLLLLGDVTRALLLVKPVLDGPGQVVLATRGLRVLVEDGVELVDGRLGPIS